MEEKMDRLLRELDSLKREKQQGEPKKSSTGRTQPVKPGVRVAF